LDPAMNGSFEIDGTYSGYSIMVRVYLW